jgi:hypothetical protein
VAQEPLGTGAAHGVAPSIYIPGDGLHEGHGNRNDDGEDAQSVDPDALAVTVQCLARNEGHCDEDG